MPKNQKIFALVDCNNFFVSCERAFRPDLWDKPVAVMSGNDGCIVARSNEVKALGIPMGGPVFKFKEILQRNNVTLFSGNFALYGDFSQRIVQILQAACPNIEVYSVDESFLEISQQGIIDYENWALKLRATILQYTGLPVSVGVASTKTLAKAAAEYAKQHPLTEGAYCLVGANNKNSATLLAWLPVDKVWGIGRAMAPKLRQLGISTAQSLSDVTDAWALKNLNITGLKTVKELRGESCLEIKTSFSAQKTILRSRSFGHNVTNYHELEGAVATFAAQAAAKLRAQNSITAEIMVFLRTAQADNQNLYVSKVSSLVQPSANTGTLISAALLLLQQLYDPDFKYKKAGIALLDLKSDSNWQLSLTEANSAATINQQTRLMATVDKINNKYGNQAIQNASQKLGNNAWQSKIEARSPGYTTSWQDLPSLK